MAASTQDTAIPRYLRYKAEEKSGDDYWDEELERANRILHDRVVRMQRDKLCTRCARFDFLRTHFYTRECIYKDKDQEAGCRKVKNNAKRPVMLRSPWFDGIRDNMPWHSFQTISGIQQKIKLLAQHPEFLWKLDSRQKVECTLCEKVVDTAVAGGLREKPPVTPGREDLTIQLRPGMLYEEGGLHRCNEWYGSHRNIADTKNALEFGIFNYDDGSYANLTRLFIRPYLQETRDLSDNTRDTLPHCCILQHRVQAHVDLDLCSRWIRNCDEQHRHTWGSHIAPRALSGFRLIDVENQCIVEGDHHARFAALSYTWGSSGQYCLTKSNKSLLEESGSLQKISQELQPVVIDSITACARLQIPYLWVDALCIVQDDAAGKHHQIQNMDFIYANAYVTLIAATGNDSSIQSGKKSSVGLARVTIPSVQAEPILIMDGVSYSYWGKNWLPPTIESDFSRSAWFSRGWTFQELVLSRRMLVFTTKEAFFYCPNGVLTESVSYADDPCQPLALEASHCIKLCSRLHKPQADGISTSIDASISSYGSYRELLNYYIRRDLTYDNDMVDAFTGVMNAHSSVSGPFYWGLPQRTFARGLIQQRVSGSYSLKSQMCRRPDFPSWSLLGWKIAKPKQNYSIFDWISSTPQVTLVHIYTYEDSSLRLLLGAWDDGTGVEGYRTQSIEYYNKATNLEALPLQPCVEELPPQLVPLLGGIEGPILVFWTHVARFQTKGDPQPEGFPRRFIDDEFGDEKEFNEQVEVILITACHEYEPVIHDERKWGIYANLYGIVIERHLGFARRIGTTFKMRLSQWLLGNPKKELIAFI